MPRSTRSLLSSQSTSDQRRARHSLIRRPRQTLNKAIVRKGSASFCANKRARVRLVEVDGDPGTFAQSVSVQPVVSPGFRPTGKRAMMTVPLPVVRELISKLPPN